MIPLYIVAGLIFSGVVIIFCIYYSNSMKMTSYLDGEIIQSEERVVRDENERREETHLVVKYSVRGHDYQVEHSLRGLVAGQYPPGRKITVWYNPTVPQMSRIKQA